MRGEFERHSKKQFVRQFEGDNTKDSLRERGRLRSIITIIARIIWCNNMENMVNLHK